MMWIVYGMLGLYIASTIVLLTGCVAQLHLLWHSKKERPHLPVEALTELPFVTIQVPVYNEKFVIEDLLKSLTQLDYPKNLFEIQVLDDSTDSTSQLIDRAANDLTSQGFDVTIIRRGNRHHYKAGALQHGLPYCKGELIAILDADFRPPANFLQALVPYFNHSGVGLVQARWGHLNREQNFLTRIQTYLLDMHFMVEQAGRFNAGYFINFCGTAGIWRKQCILDAGGWDGAVLSEDLDLSYRAQLKGWRILYNKNILVPAQLPAVMEAFKIQQFRWTKGMAQTARKSLGNVWKAALPLPLKLHSNFHLLGSFTFLCLFSNALLTIPLLWFRHHFTGFISLTNYTAIGALNLFALGFLYYKTAIAQGENHRRFFMNYPLFVVVYLALSVQNSIAVLQGISGIQTAFVRTPKFSLKSSTSKGYSAKANKWIILLEVALLLYFVCGIGLSFYFGDYFFLFFFMMITSGLLILLYPLLPKLKISGLLSIFLPRNDLSKPDLI